MPVKCLCRVKCQVKGLCRVKGQVAEYNAKLPSFMPSKMSIAKFHANFLEIQVLLLVQLPGTINQHIHTAIHSQ